MLFDKIKKVLTAKQRHDAQDILLQAEIMASKSNLPVNKVISKIIESGEKNPYIKEVDSRIKSKRYTKKHELYKDIMDDDVINILKSAYESGVSGEEIISNYIESKKITSKVAGKIRGGMMEPLILFVLVSLITWYGINKLRTEFSKLPGFDASLLTTVASAMPFIIVIPVVLILIGVFVFPHKLPGIKGIWTEAKSTLYLSLLLTIYNLNLYSRILYFFTQIKDPEITKAFKKLPAEKKKKQTEGIFVILSKYLNATEKALLSVAIAYNSEKDAIMNITAKRLESITVKAELVTIMLNRVGIVGAILPVLLYVTCMFSSVNQVMDIATKASAPGGGQSISAKK